MAVKFYLTLFAPGFAAMNNTWGSTGGMFPME